MHAVLACGPCKYWRRPSPCTMTCEMASNDGRRATHLWPSIHRAPSRFGTTKGQCARFPFFCRLCDETRRRRGARRPRLIPCCGQDRRMLLVATPKGIIRCGAFGFGVAFISEVAISTAGVKEAPQTKRGKRKLNRGHRYRKEGGQ